MEKKYVLAKDTPTAKKGDKIQIDKLSVFVHNKWNGIECLFMINNPYDNVNAEIARLLKEGWIKEVKPPKPLEIWVNEYSENTITVGGYFLGLHLYVSEKHALENAVSSNYIRTVHFIEAPDNK